MHAETVDTKRKSAGLNRDEWRFPPALIDLFTNKYAPLVCQTSGICKAPWDRSSCFTVSLIRSYGNKNKSKIRREEQVDDGWRCFPSPRYDAVAVVVTVATGLTTFLCSIVLSSLGNINMFYPQFSINWANWAVIVTSPSCRRLERSFPKQLESKHLRLLKTCAHSLVYIQNSCLLHATLWIYTHI